MDLPLLEGRQDQGLRVQKSEKRSGDLCANCDRVIVLDVGTNMLDPLNFLRIKASMERRCDKAPSQTTRDTKCTEARSSSVDLTQLKDVRVIVSKDRRQALRIWNFDNMGMVSQHVKTIVCM